LSPKPPSQATIAVRVNVGVQNVPITGPEVGDDHLLWHYVTVVKPGQLKVLCTIGDVTSMKDVEAKPYETSIVNFCFGKPVVTLTARTLKIRARRREHERISVKGPAGDGQPGQVS